MVGSRDLIAGRKIVEARIVGALLVGGLVVAMGCESDQSIVRQEVTDLFYQEPTNEVDILWVVDNSLSMEDEQAGIGAKFDSFIGSLEATNIDFHIGVVTTDIDDPDQNGKLQAPLGEDLYITPETPDYSVSFAERVAVGTGGSDKERGIEAALVGLTEPVVSGYNGGFVRDGATLSIIYLSDENDCTDRGALNGNDDASACYDNNDDLVALPDLIQDYQDIKTDGSRVLVSSIVGPEIVENCEGAKPGFRYEGMAEAFGGVQESICSTDFGAIMEELGLQVSGVMTSFQLSEYAVESTIVVYDDEDIVEADTSDGWSYDAEYAILYFHGSGIPERGSEITVIYEVAG